LLDHLPHERPAATVDDRWAIVAIDSNATGTTAAPGVQSPTHSAAVAFRILLRALRRSCGDDSDRLARLVLPIVNEQSGLALVGQTLDFTERFDIPPGVAGPAAVFTAAGLLPASVMGLDIVRLLQGAAAMNERFGLAPIGDNPPLDFAGILKLMRRRVSKAAVRFATFSRGGRAVGKFCETLANGDNLRSEISDSRFQNVDLQSAAPPLRVQLIVESVRRDRIAIHPDDASANPLARSIPDLNAAAIEARKAALAAAGQSSVEIKLASLDEFSLGQLFQMLIIARVLESRL
jgi:glucose-6-phosphate isomerase